MVDQSVGQTVVSEEFADRSLDDATVAATVIEEGDKGGAADGLESDAARFLCATGYQHQAISRRRPSGDRETLLHDPRLRWPGALSLASNGHLRLTANQPHRPVRSQGGEDRRHKPYALFRLRPDAQPILLR